MEDHKGFSHIFVLIGVVSVVGIATIAIGYFVRSSAGNSSKNNGSNQNPPSSRTPITVYPLNEASKALEKRVISESKNIEFTVTEDWEVNLSGDDSIHKVYSPYFKITDEDGKAVNAWLELVIEIKSLRGQAFRALESLPEDIIDSMTITYSSPSPEQNKTSQLNFVGFNYPTSGFLSGQISYKIGQKIGEQNISNIDLWVYFTLNTCDHELQDESVGLRGCSSWAPMKLSKKMWLETPMLQQGQDVLESMTFR